MPRLLSLLIGLCVLLAFSVFGGDQESSLWPFVGRFHPLLVHLPIGVFILALIADEYSRARSRSAMRSYIPLMFLLGAWSSIAAAIVGLVLADWGSYDPAVLIWHRRLGIAMPTLNRC